MYLADGWMPDDQDAYFSSYLIYHARMFTRTEVAEIPIDGRMDGGVSHTHTTYSHPYLRMWMYSCVAWGEVRRYGGKKTP